MNESLTLAKNIVNIKYTDLPAAAVDKAKKSFMDQLGVILAASGLSPECRPFIDLAVQGGGKKESRVFGEGVKVPAYMAAYANASYAHALDYEDVHDDAGVHPNAQMVPAAVAVAEYMGNISGKEFITAMALGTDLACRLSMAKDPSVDPNKAGWYMPPVFGAQGAAAAAGKLLGLNAEELLDAFSMTMCQATCSAELVNSSKTVIRSIRDAFAAKAGTISAFLAQKGVKGFEEPFEGRAGFYTMYLQGKFDPAILLKDLGKTFHGATISYKAWPACRGTHSYIQSALQLAGELPGSTDDIKEIVIRVGNEPISRMLWEPLERKKKPAVAIDAKFSIPYTVATALAYKKVMLDHFTPQYLGDRNILKISEKITAVVDPKFSRENTDALVKINYEGKDIESKGFKYVYGNPNNPMSDDEFMDKFIDCARHAAKPLPDKKIKNLSDLILHMEDLKNVNDIFAFL
jgi:2-methylcitrate dehydratase PrpD